MQDSTPMSELLAYASWYDATWLAVAGVFSLIGIVLALRLMPAPSDAPARQSQAGITQSFWRCSLVFAFTGWGVFLACFKAFYPHLEPGFPPLALLQSWSVEAVAATLSTLIATRGARNIRNVALAGALLSGGASCMLFLGMSGLAAPAPLGYDLRGILVAMAGSGTLAAAGFWQAGTRGTWKEHLTAAGLIASSLVLVASGSLASILSFSDWSQAIERPEGIAFQPIGVVFVCEAGVTTVLTLIGAAIDRRAASLIDRENERLRELADSTFEALVIHRDGIVIDANRVFCHLVGKHLVAVKGERFATFLCDQAGIPGTVAPAPTSASFPADERQIIGASGQRLPVQVLSRAIAFAGGTAVVTALRDIGERQAAEEKIRFLAHHDALTGLPNRALLHDVIALHLAQAENAGDMIAVLCLDLDRFKAVNDAFGHQAGDRLLQLAADRIRANIRDSDAAARIGGDEFVLLLARIPHVELAAQLARRLIDHLSLPFDLGSFEARIGASIGIAIGPRDGTTAEILISNADIALYQAKANGRGGLCVFEGGMDKIQQERRSMEHDLRQAVAEQSFELVFQPQFSCSSREVVAFEALMRWSHPVRGAISPSEFIPVAEATGLIVPLGRWALRTACLAALAWPRPHIVAVNVSARQFIGDDFAETVEAVLGETGLDAGRLELEITESLMMCDTERALDSLRRLKGLGVHLALDDFGTGFSSLSYLQRFPFDKVKIDRAFIRDMTERESARAIVGVILAMSRQLKLAVTAEGVETEEQFALLRQQGCDMAQGFLLSRPIPMQGVASFLAAMPLSQSERRFAQPAAA
jgi:diguanylate cyclase (GGDEF)-like protein/PAS domain S-box-containing protein